MPKRHLPLAASKGLECPVCLTILSEVIETRQQYGYIGRRRRCINGHRFSTWELEAVSAERMVAIAGLIENAVKRGKQ